MRGAADRETSGAVSQRERETGGEGETGRDRCGGRREREREVRVTGLR